MVQDRINSIFQEVFDDPALQVTPATSPADLADWDSVSQVKLILCMEEAFGVRLATEEVTHLSSVGAFLEALRRHGVSD